MKEICWATNGEIYHKDEFCGIPLGHWSRKFEYPWIMDKGGFLSNELIFDAAGGDAPLQLLMSQMGGAVINMDLSLENLENGKKRYNRGNIIRYVGSIDKTGFPNGLFHRVVCASVLEHCLDPGIVLKELWRVLMRGGRLLLTFDVASYHRWNHSIDYDLAGQIAKAFGLELPVEPPNILNARYPEHEPRGDDPEFVDLKVLCMAVDKGENNV